MSCAPNWEVGEQRFCSVKNIQILGKGRPVFYNLPFYTRVLPALVHHHLHQHEGAHEDEAGEPACSFMNLGKNNLINFKKFCSFVTQNCAMANRGMATKARRKEEKVKLHCLVQ